MPADEVRLVLRIPAEMHAAVKNLATIERRSINAQILRLIEVGLDADTK